MKIKENDCVYIENYNELLKIVTALKALDYKIVVTQGSWDLPHIGHYEYIKKAKEYGDILIVGIDSDKVVKKRKGGNRPIMNQEERIAMVGHLRYPNYTTVIENKNGIEGELIRLLKPDVLVISESTRDPNYKETMEKEYSEYCDQIILLPPQATTSTSARIRFIIMEIIDEIENGLLSILSKFTEEIKQFVQKIKSKEI